MAIYVCLGRFIFTNDVCEFESNNIIISQKRLKTILNESISTRERTVAQLKSGNVKTDLTM